MSLKRLVNYVWQEGSWLENAIATIVIGVAAMLIVRFVCTFIDKDNTWAVGFVSGVVFGLFLTIEQVVSSVRHRIACDRKHEEKIQVSQKLF